MYILETERLRLRRFTLDDLDEIYRLVYADPIVKNAWSAAEGTPDKIKERFAAKHILAEGNFGFRAIVHKESGNLIGLIGFQRHEPGEGQDIYYLFSENEPNRRVGFDPDFIEAELTYVLGRPYWKKGYATEIGKAMVAYGFKTLGIGHIIQGVRSENLNSINLMKRLGFRVEKGLHPEQTVGILDNIEMTQKCPECGAIWDDEATCQDHFHQMLFWENENPDYGAEVHHLMVLSYYIQHPSLYSPEGLKEGIHLLAEFVEGGATPDEVRKRNRAKVASNKRKWKIKGTAASHGSFDPPIRWPMTSTHVIEGGVHHYSDNVKRWAQSIHEALKAAR